MKLADKIIQSRKRQGLTQEALAEKASINLRTLQRIEKGKTEPRGQTLQLIAEALNFPVEDFQEDDLLNYIPAVSLSENRSFLWLLNLSALTFWIFPLGNLIVPAVLWKIKRSEIQGVQKLGRQLLSFQLIWSFLCYGLLLGTILCAFIHPPGMNPLLPSYLMGGVGLLCLINSVLIIVAHLAIKGGKLPFYARLPQQLKIA